MESYEKNTLNIHEFYENRRNELKITENHEGMLTQLLLTHLLFVLTVYQINAISLIFYSTVRYSDYLIYIFINIYGNIRN